MGRLSPWLVRGLVLGLGVVLGLLAPLGTRGLTAQNSCELAGSRGWTFAARGTPAETHWFTRALFVCQDGSRIYSDSAIMSPPQRLSQLFGNVRFTEEGRELTANRATYRTDIDRLDAIGDVVLVDSAGGSRIEGDNLVYLRSGNARIQDQLTVTGIPGQRPRAVIVPRSRPPDSTSVDSTTVDTTTVDTATVDSTAAIDAVIDTLVQDTLAPDTADTPANDVLQSELPPDSTLMETAPAEEPRLPYTVVADRIVLVGEESFRGEGNAEVERGSLKAYGDNMVYSEETGELIMSGDARSEGDGYALSGQVITVLLPGDEVREIVARRQAALLTDDLDLTAPKIRIFVDQEDLQRLVAGPLGEEDGRAFAGAVSGPGVVSGPPAQPAGADRVLAGRDRDPNRAVAAGEEFTLVGDSLDIETPGEVLERVKAIGLARAESYTRDSLNTEGTPELALHDWIEGDTLVATFARRAVADDLILDRLVATGSARSLYRLESNDSTTAGPKELAIHYVLGNEITIEMQEGDIDQMAVSGDTRGFHLEPRALVTLPDTLGGGALIGDSAGVDVLPADTVLPVDTIAAVDTTQVAVTRPHTVTRPYTVTAVPPSGDGVDGKRFIVGGGGPRGGLSHLHSPMGDASGWGRGAPKPEIWNTSVRRPT